MEFIVAHLHNLLEMRYCQGNLKSFKITFTESLTLNLLAKTPRGLPQFIIASHLSLSRNAVGKLIDSLSARELVERNENPSNRREKIVTLTASGKETVTNIRQINASILTDECDHFVQTATPWNQPQAQFREAKAGHIVRHD